MREKVRTAAVLGLRFLFLTRYSWLLALVLVALPPASLQLAPALLENLFVLDEPIQIWHVSWIAMLCAATVIGTLRITALNAMDRFEDYRLACTEFQAAWGTGGDRTSRWYERWEGWLTLLLGLAAAVSIWYVTIAACVSMTSSDPGPGWGVLTHETMAQGLVTRIAWRRAIEGGALTLGVLGTIYGLVAVYQIWFAERAEVECAFHARRPSTPLSSQVPPELLEEMRKCAEQHSPAEFRVFRWCTGVLGPGYFRELVFRRGDSIRRRVVVAPGHASVFFSTLMFLGWYFWNYGSVLRDGRMPDEGSAMPALFFGLLSLLLVILILPGLAFFLDRHRVPVLPAMVVTMGACYGIFATDHYYELNPGQRAAPASPLPNLVEVYDRWRIPDGLEGQRTLVVVDAAGGGIQASAWTAQVLTGLHEIYGDAFSRSVGLISAVSGGSVGTMFYLANRGEADPDFDWTQPETVLTNDAVRRIRESSRASGLEASCWGIAYPDTLRALFPPLAGRTIDRGWSIEQIWRERMQAAAEARGDWRLGELSNRSQRSQLPVVAFNATLVETGQRLIIGSVLGPPATGDQPGGSWEFAREFPEAQLRVSTAARLSATFPYVTPVSRPWDSRLDPRAAHSPLEHFHVADGAYADNEGVVTSVDWINRLLVHYSRPEHLDRRPFDRILLLRIQALPRQPPRRQARASSLAGWRAALLGPMDAVMNVRSASQIERGDLEINLLTRATVAEIRANRERTEREFQTALAQVDQLAAIRAELHRLAAESPDSPADRARQFLEVEDRLYAAKALLERAQDRNRRSQELLVESVVFDFWPVDNVRTPLSWKLTARQKRQIDHSWDSLVHNQLPSRPLDTLDRYFARREPYIPRTARQNNTPTNK